MKNIITITIFLYNKIDLLQKGFSKLYWIKKKLFGWMRLSLCLDPFQEINLHLIWWLHHISPEHTEVIQPFQNVLLHYTGGVSILQLSNMVLWRKLVFHKPVINWPLFLTMWLWDTGNTSLCKEVFYFTVCKVWPPNSYQKMWIQ